MYQSWTEAPVAHLKIEHSDDFPVLLEPPPQRDLIIFDTWGTSSYYHLLLDHIEPLWITREYLRQSLGIFDGLVDYYRISNNGYQSELETTLDIFQHFLGKRFVEDADGAYRNVVYGYFFSYRPYLGPNLPELFFLNYQRWLSEFRLQFCPSQIRVKTQLHCL